MAEKTLRVKIVTPEETVFQGEVDMVVAPGINGEIGILPLHIPIVSVLKVGELRLKYDDNKWDYIAVDGGYLEVSEDVVTVLADAAAFASKIDIERLQTQKQKVEEKLAALKEGDDEFVAASRELARLTNRLRVAAKKKSA